MPSLRILAQNKEAPDKRRLAPLLPREVKGDGGPVEVAARSRRRRLQTRAELPQVIRSLGAGRAGQTEVVLTAEAMPAGSNGMSTPEASRQ